MSLASEAKQPETGEGGAQAALAGFLYEIIGVLGLAVVVESDLDPDPDGDLAALVRLGDGTVWHETWGQDAAILPDARGCGEQGGTLIQFKFSLTPATAPIQPAHLKEVASRLHASCLAARDHGHEIQHFALVSNRHLSPEAPELLRKARAGEEIKDTEDSTIDVLSRLVPLTGQDLPFWHGAVERFMSRYGADPADSQRAIDTLVGQEVRRVAHGYRQAVTLSDILYALLRVRDVRSLAHGDDNGVFTAALEEVVSDEVGIIDRPALAGLAETLAIRALVVVDGPGGSGKTTSVLHSLWKASVAAEPKLPIWLEAERVTDDPVAKAIRGFMGVDDARDNWIRGDGVALSRLRKANPGLSRPIAIIALDATDQPGPDARSRPAVMRLIDHFARADARFRNNGEPPDASLIVTCRTEADVRKSLLRSKTGQPAPEGTYELLRLGYFSAEELIDAAEHVGDGVGVRIRDSLELRSSEDPAGSREGLVSVASLGPMRRSQTVRPEILAYLQHPALWGQFAGMPGPDQHAVLDGQDQALQNLADRFLDRFCSKIEDRQYSGNQPPEELKRHLAYIARSHLVGMGLTHQIQDWEYAARDIGNLRPSAFYLEAVGYGIVEQVAKGQWRWAHAFVHRYLAAL